VASSSQFLNLLFHLITHAFEAGGSCLDWYFVSQVTELFLSLVILLSQHFHIQVHHFEPPRGLFLFASRAATALLAISDRCSGLNFLARALPPRLPSSTAAESFFFAIAGGILPLR
jgi:hypothetical protein